MAEPLSVWIGTEEYGGVPTPTRRGPAAPPHWRLEAIAATERPRSLAPSADGRSIVFVHDRETSDVWTLEVESGELRRLTTGRDPMPYWEDTTPALSPDGRQVAYANEGWIEIVPSTGGVPRRLVEAGSPVWLGNDRLVVTAERDDQSRLTVIELADPWPQPLVRTAPGLERRGDEEEAVVSPDGRTVAFSFRHLDDLNRSDIRVVDVASGEANGLTGEVATRDTKPTWSPDGGTLAFSAQRGEWYAVHLYNIAAGIDHVLAEPQADVSELHWSPAGDSIAAVCSLGGRHDLVTVDVATGEIDLRARGGAYGAPCWAPDGSLVVTYEDHATPPELRRVAPDGTVKALLTPAPAAVRAAPHVTPEEVWFRSSDGFEVQALLFRPPVASDEQPVPAVVYPHGGPTECYGDEWDGHAQYFVDKGYAWLALNFRGSTGRGRAVERMNFDDWGGGDMHDCLAAADFLRTLPWVDGGRLAVFGASYGSYMALCSVVEDAGERFRAAVCKYGDCNLLTSWSQGDRAGVYYSGENMLGHPSRNRDAWLRGSPILRIDRIAVPLLIATGERDERVHPCQSAELVEALRSRAKTFEYVTYPTEAHGFLRAGPQIDFYRRVEQLLDWYLL